MQPSKVGSHLFFSRDGTANLPYTPLLQRTLPRKDDDQDRTLPYFTGFKSTSPTSEGELLWMGPTCPPPTWKIGHFTAKCTTDDSWNRLSYTHLASLWEFWTLVATPILSKYSNARWLIALLSLTQSQCEGCFWGYVISQKVELSVKVNCKSQGQQSHQRNAALTS